VAGCAALAGCAQSGAETGGRAADSGLVPPPVSDEGADPAELAQLIEAADLPPCPASSRIPPLTGGLPNLTLPCLGAGPSVTLSGLRGSPLVVNVWASWCSPCASEMPHLLAARKGLTGKISFLGLNMVDRRTAALAWAKDFGMTFPSVQDADGVIRSKLRVPAPPATIFVRPDGRIAKIHYGAFTSERAVREAAAEHLRVRA
jgi:cytochrome c biogenesis protein CcmG/thiol:disulfide interchange protein DsbE